MDLILWRHADAEDSSPGGDLGRALTARGRAQAERMAAWLAPRLPEATRVLASPALRCQQTAAALDRRVETVPSLGSGASADAMLAAAGWPDGAGPVLVVGHQPTIGQAAATVLGAGAAFWEVEKAGVWWLRRGPSGAVRVHAVHGPDDL